MCMVSGLDSSYAAAIFVGYHSRAGSSSSPLAHTLATNLEYIKINGVYASEFLINAYAAALKGVPVVFVSGDQGLTDEVKETNSNITTLAVKKGIGKSTINIHPQKAIGATKTLVENALKSNCSLCSLVLPETFEVELAYKQHETAFRNSFYPGAKLIEPNIVSYSANKYEEVLTFFNFTT